MFIQLPSAATVTMDARVEHRDDNGTAVFAFTPTAATTINAVPDGIAGQNYFLFVRTVGATSYVTTFGANFVTQGTLTSGTTAGKTFVMEFISDGSTLVEVSRTTAM